MECNKEEAIRAKGIAEKKMENKDFAGARKIALKAQQLYAEIDNISQMVCVCDVHCSAENKIGNEMDLYGILKLEQSADDTMIKKQYRKLALLLHPDKNKFPGAEAAFKLIMEAQRALLDKEKRAHHDNKRRQSSKPVIPTQRRPQQPSRNKNVERQPQGQNYNFTAQANAQGGGFTPMSQQQQQHPSGGRSTFWTVCPFCAVRYQYYREVLGKALKCQSCAKPFFAYDVNASAKTPGTNPNLQGFAQRASNQHSTVPPSSNGFQGYSGPQNPTSGYFPGAGCKVEVGSQKVNEPQQGVNGVDKDGASKASKPVRKTDSKKRKKRAGDSSQSSASESSSDDDVEIADDDFLGKSFEGEGDSYPRRSARSRRHVSYTENQNDDDEILTPSEKGRRGGLSSPVKEKFAASAMEEQTKEAEFHASAAGASEGSAGREASKAEGKHNSMNDVPNRPTETNDVSPPAPELHEYPDPDFSDFDKLRDEACFRVGDLWGVYDTLDAMPRFYAQIKKVFSSGFKLRITWLEPNPDDNDGKEWAEASLPYSCGRFRQGLSENTQDRLMFSHRMCWRKGSGNEYFVYPTKGETWAIFKNWDIQWKSSPDGRKEFEYEFIEILSDYDERDGIKAAYLIKLKGFASLFCRRGGDELRIPANELLRLSHRVISFKMTGEEREDVPRNSFELDPGCISLNMQEFPIPEEIKLEKGNMGCDGLASKSAGAIPKDQDRSVPCGEDNWEWTQVEPEKNVDEDDMDHVTSPDDYAIPEPEFFNFDGMKALDKFKVGQIWALYSEWDGLPKYYGQVTKVGPDSQLCIAWLEVSSLPNTMLTWKDDSMPISCGRFKVKGGTSSSYSYEGSAAFSHQLRAEPTSKRNVYDIYPSVGEVWAMYKDWKPEIAASELKNCEYKLVEVVEGRGLHRRVLVLERVPGYSAVFKRKMEGSSCVTLEVPGAELIKFSHQVPAFRLTEEKLGSLRGFWELDPAALPIDMFFTS